MEETAAAEKPQAGGERETECNLQKALDQIFLPPFRQEDLGMFDRKQMYGVAREKAKGDRKA